MPIRSHGAMIEVRGSALSFGGAEMSGDLRWARAAAAAACGALLIIGPTGPATGQVYPPVLPGPTQTTAPVDVLGARVTRQAPPATKAAAPKVEAAGARLAVTGMDAIPYAAGAVVLVVGGVGIVFLTRRPVVAKPQVRHRAH